MMWAFLQDLEQDLQTCRDTIRILQKRAAYLERVLAGEITASEMPESYTPRVSDHALVQWMTRAHDVPMEEFRRAILTPKREEAIRMGCSRIRAGRITFIVQNGTIVTCIRNGGAA